MTILWCLFNFVLTQEINEGLASVAWKVKLPKKEELSLFKSLRLMNYRFFKMTIDESKVVFNGHHIVLKIVKRQ